MKNTAHALNASRLVRKVREMGFTARKATNGDYPDATSFYCSDTPEGCVRIETVLGMDDVRRIENTTFGEWKRANRLPAGSLPSHIEDALWAAFRKQGVPMETKVAEDEAMLAYTVRLAAALGKAGYSPEYDGGNGPALLIAA